MPICRTRTTLRRRSSCRGSFSSRSSRSSSNYRSCRCRSSSNCTGHTNRNTSTFFFYYNFTYAAFLSNAYKFTNLINIHVIVLLGGAGLLLQHEIDFLGYPVLAQIGAGLVGEQGVHEHVLLALGQIANLGGALVVGGGHQRAGGDLRIQDLGVAGHLRHDFLVMLPGALP